MKFYPGFPIRIEHKDGNDKKTCWFQCQNHLDKYVTRSKLKKSDYTVEYEDPRLKPVEKVSKKTTPVPKPKTPKKLFSSLEQFFEPNETSVAHVVSSPRRKSTQKRQSSR